MAKDKDAHFNEREKKALANENHKNKEIRKAAISARGIKMNLRGVGNAKLKK